MMKEAPDARKKSRRALEIIGIAKKYRYKILPTPHNPVLISFCKGRKTKGTWQRVDVYFTTMTVATALKHPKRGKSQLYRRDVSMSLMEEIFNNPRVHSQKGYY